MTFLLLAINIVFAFLALTHLRWYRNFWIGAALTSTLGATVDLLHHNWLIGAIWLGTATAASYCAVFDRPPSGRGARLP